MVEEVEAEAKAVVGVPARVIVRRDPALVALEEEESQIPEGGRVDGPVGGATLTSPSLSPLVFVGVLEESPPGKVEEDELRWRSHLKPLSLMEAEEDHGMPLPMAFPVGSRSGLLKKKREKW